VNQRSPTAKLVTISLPCRVHEQGKALAARGGTTFSGLVRALIEHLDTTTTSGSAPAGVASACTGPLANPNVSEVVHVQLLPDEGGAAPPAPARS
jgi:hypothetical protein